MTRRMHLFGISFLLVAVAVAGQNPTPAPTQTPSPAAAEPKAAIEGTVTRAGTGQPLKAVQVTVRRTDSAGQAGRGGRGAGSLGGLAGGTAGLGALGDLLTAVMGGGRGGTTMVSTDASGHFSVSGLEAGQYQISADREGMIHQEYGRRSGSGRGTSVVIAAGQHFAANFQMDPAGVIIGRVRDITGEPVFRATVQAYSYRYSNGERTLAQVASIQTDYQGQYSLFPLTPGDYFISVTTTPETATPSQADASAPASATAARGAVQQQLLASIPQLAGLQSPLLQGLGLPGGPAPFFYPGTIDADSAAPIHVAASAEVRGVDLNLRPTPTVVVRGRVAAPFSLAANTAGRGGQQSPTPQTGARGANAGQAGQAANILNLLGAAAGSNAQLTFTRIGSARAGLGALMGGLNPIRVAADGAFEIPNVAPGSYFLGASASDNGQRYTGRVRVDVAGGDVSNVIVEVRAGIEVHGKITVDTPPPQFKMSQLRINLVEAGNPAGAAASQLGNLLQSANTNRGRGGQGGGQGAVQGAGRGGGQVGTTAMPQVADDGTFTLANVATSVEYRVTISNAAGGYLLDGRIGSADALGSTFTVEDGSTLNLRIGFATGKVTGTVLDSGKPFAGAQVVLVPDAPRRGRNDLYFTATSDATGVYSFNTVPAGNYHIFAWEDVATGSYQYPDFIRPFEPLGVPVRVEQDGSSGGELKLIPATTG